MDSTGKNAPVTGASRGAGDSYPDPVASPIGDLYAAFAAVGW